MMRSLLHEAAQRFVWGNVGKGSGKVRLHGGSPNGKYIRLTTQQNREHHITIPNHSPIKIGTLSAILCDIQNHFDVTREELLTQLFS